MINNTFLNFSYNNESVDSRSELIRKWYYRAYVNDTSGNNISGANVTAYPQQGGIEFNLITDSTGYTQLGEITDYTNNGGTKSYYSNYTIFASNSSYFTSNHTYNVTAQQSNYKDVFSLQAGPNITSCTVLATANTIYTQQANIINNALTDNCIIISAQNITFNCNGYYIDSDDNYAGVYSNQLNTTIKNCNISMGVGSWPDIGIGIELNRANNSYIYNNTLNNQNTGLLLNVVKNVIAEKNTINSNSKDGINLTGASGNIISNNNITKNGDKGILIEDGAENNIIANNIISNNTDDGINVRFTSYNNITGNIINNNGNFTSNKGDGIANDGGNYSWFINNIITNNADDGLELDDGATSNIVINNTINSNKGDGMHIESNTINNKVENNTISNNSDDGMDIERGASHNIIIRNFVNNNGGSGIILLNSTTINNTIIYNIVNGSGRLDPDTDQIVIGSNSSLNNIINNTITWGADHGIKLEKTYNNTILNNTIFNNSGDGIHLNLSNYNIISYNTVKNNSGEGIDLRYSNYTTIINNTVQKNYDGVQLSYSNYNNITNNVVNDNTQDGIKLRDYSSYNSIISNIVNNNGIRDGIRFRDSSNNNKVANNTACNNGDDDLDCQASSGNYGTGNIFGQGKVVMCGGWPIYPNDYKYCT